MHHLHRLSIFLEGDGEEEPASRRQDFRPTFVSASLRPFFPQFL